jgi:hypothetical protein
MQLQLKKQLQIERVCMATHHVREYFRNVSHKITKFALLKILKEYEKTFQQFFNECKVYCRSIMGLPCCHEMQVMKEPLSLDDIHSHWHLENLIFCF